MTRLTVAVAMTLCRGVRAMTDCRAKLAMTGSQVETGRIGWKVDREMIGSKAATAMTTFSARSVQIRLMAVQEQMWRVMQAPGKGLKST